MFLSGIRVVTIAVAVGTVFVLSGCAVGEATKGSQPPVSQTPSSTSLVESATVASSSAVPSTPPAASPPPAPSVKPGTIVVRGSGPTMFGPYQFKSGGYTFKFEQAPPPGQEFNETSLVISLESKPLGYDEPYQLLCNTSEMTGTNQVVVKGKLWVDVSSSANDYVLTFTPKRK